MPPNFPDNNRGGDMRDMMSQRDSRDMIGDSSRGYFRDLDSRGQHDPRSGVPQEQRTMRDYQLQQEMRDRVSFGTLQDHTILI